MPTLLILKADLYEAIMLLSMKKSNLLLFLILSLVLTCVLSAKNLRTGSDPRGTLLVSESLLINQTIKLDNYNSEILSKDGLAIHSKNGHSYYYFPIGTSIASVPFVLLARIFGYEMSRDEATVQIGIAAVSSIAIVLLLINIAKLFIGEINSILIGSVFWFGSSLSSTSGTALWSHNFAVLFSLCGIYLLIKPSKLEMNFHPILIGICLFSAYLCRPTMAILAPLAILCCYTYSKISSLKILACLCILLSIFMLFCVHEFNQLLPDYYLPSRLMGKDFYRGLLGNLFSPARGLFIYSPFILVAWICFKYSEKNWGLNYSWLLIGLVWPIIHLVFISRFPHWWGGHSFGPRLMTDVLPGIFLLTLYTWPTEFKSCMAKITAGVLLTSCIFSILVITGQGLYSKYTILWNQEPNIDENTKYLFDWHYPQFLASKSGHLLRILEHKSKP
jgi:hypothetical protein